MYITELWKKKLMRILFFAFLLAAKASVPDNVPRGEAASGESQVEDEEKDDDDAEEEDNDSSSGVDAEEPAANEDPIVDPYANSMKVVNELVRSVSKPTFYLFF